MNLYLLAASASQHAVNNERESALQHAAGNGGLNGSSIDQTSGGTAPPNYEELDPPPAYSVLFPNQKADSSTTLSSLAATAPASPSAASPSGIAAETAATTADTSAN